MTAQIIVQDDAALAVRDEHQPIEALGIHDFLHEHVKASFDARTARMRNILVCGFGK